MFATAAHAQTAVAGAPAPGASTGGPLESIGAFAPMALILVVGYFMVFRPQQQRTKAHQAKIAGVKRGDTVVLSSGVTGKVVRVEDTDALVEIAPTTQVRVVKAMISDIRPLAAANDVKS